MWDKQQADGENQGWMDAAITLLDPVTTGSYINESDFLRRPERASLYMSPENWKRLEALRRRNDPLGVFPAPMKINA
jgi:FAD/FMN-containing dehydrogenase